MQINSLAFRANTSAIFLTEELYFHRLSQTLLNNLWRETGRAEGLSVKHEGSIPCLNLPASTHHPGFNSVACIPPLPILGSPRGVSLSGSFG